MNGTCTILRTTMEVPPEHLLNKNALSSVESRVFVDTISSDEVNRARAFVIRRGGSAYKRAGDARRLA